MVRLFRPGVVIRGPSIVCKYLLRGSKEAVAEVIGGRRRLARKKVETLEVIGLTRRAKISNASGSQCNIVVALGHNQYSLCDIGLGEL